jgi:hypothetical protein
MLEQAASRSGPSGAGSRRCSTGRAQARLSVTPRLPFGRRPFLEPGHGPRHPAVAGVPSLRARSSFVCRRPRALVRQPGFGTGRSARSGGRCEMDFRARPPTTARPHSSGAEDPTRQQPRGPRRRYGVRRDAVAHTIITTRKNGPRSLPAPRRHGEHLRRQSRQLEGDYRGARMIPSWAVLPLARWPTAATNRPRRRGRRVQCGLPGHRARPRSAPQNGKFSDPDFDPYPDEQMIRDALARAG